MSKIQIIVDYLHPNPTANLLCQEKGHSPFGSSLTQKIEIFLQVHTFSLSRSFKLFSPGFNLPQSQKESSCGHCVVSEFISNSKIEKD